MLRLVVFVLLLLNGLYFGWAQGWFLSSGFGPMVQREPQRLAQQVRPEAVEVITGVAPTQADALSASAEPSVTVALCLQSPPLEAAQATTLRRVLQASLPESSWQLNSLMLSERWIIYMGKYANAAELAKKRAQLANLRLNFQPLDSAALLPGLSLGAYASQPEASAALDALVLRGVRTARVVQELPARQGFRLRLPVVDEALGKQLPAVRAALAGKLLEACPVPTSQ
jgi:hypothetical protein